MRVVDVVAAVPAEDDEPGEAGQPHGPDDALGERDPLLEREARAVVAFRLDSRSCLRGGDSPPRQSPQATHQAWRQRPGRGRRTHEVTRRLGERERTGQALLGAVEGLVSCTGGSLRGEVAEGAVRDERLLGDLVVRRQQRRAARLALRRPQRPPAHGNAEEPGEAVSVVGAACLQVPYQALRAHVDAEGRLHVRPLGHRAGVRAAQQSQQTIAEVALLRLEPHRLPHRRRHLLQDATHGGGDVGIVGGAAESGEHRRRPVLEELLDHLILVLRGLLGSCAMGRRCRCGHLHGEQVHEAQPGTIVVGRSPLVVPARVPGPARKPAEVLAKGVDAIAVDIQRIEGSGECLDRMIR